MGPVVFVKLCDIICQILALLLPALFSHDNAALLIGWVTLGGAQLLSCGINFLLLNKQYRAGSRRAYEWFSLIFAGSCFICLLCKEHYGTTSGNIDTLFEGVVWSSICLSPALAIWYVVMCVAEIAKINNSQPQ